VSNGRRFHSATTGSAPEPNLVVWPSGPPPVYSEAAAHMDDMFRSICDYLDAYLVLDSLTNEGIEKLAAIRESGADATPEFLERYRREAP